MKHEADKCPVKEHEDPLDQNRKGKQAAPGEPTTQAGGRD
ncbi:hypothetical protein M3J09_009678 [Ascochyta lentis]